MSVWKMVAIEFERLEIYKLTIYETIAQSGDRMLHAYPSFATRPDPVPFKYLHSTPQLPGLLAFRLLRPDSMHNISTIS